MSAKSEIGNFERAENWKRIRSIGSQPPEAKWIRPATRGLAIRQTDEIYLTNDWDRIEQIRYEISLGLEEKANLRDRSNDELRVILADMEFSRMVIYES